jgi:predicted phage replisome organizer
VGQVKKFYWIKLQKDFFKRHDIRIIESMPNGKDYILFYLKLLVESVSHDGNLRFSDTIPYNAEMLAAVTNTNVDIVRNATRIFTELDLMEILDDQTIYMTELQKMVGRETEWAAKKRLQRSKQGLLEDSKGTLSSNSGTNEGQKGTLSDKSKSKSKSKSKDITIGAKSKDSPPPEPAVIDLILNDKSSYPITQSKIDEFKELYPAVDVMQELRKMKGWLIANPTNRKTKRGILRFVNSWLSREQDRSKKQKPATESGWKSL